MISCLQQAVSNTEYFQGDLTPDEAELKDLLQEVSTWPCWQTYFYMIIFLRYHVQYEVEPYGIAIL